MLPDGASQEHDRPAPPAQLRGHQNRLPSLPSNTLFPPRARIPVHTGCGAISSITRDPRSCPKRSLKALPEHSPGLVAPESVRGRGTNTTHLLHVLPRVSEDDLRPRWEGRRLLRTVGRNKPALITPRERQRNKGQPALFPAACT